MDFLLGFIAIVLIIGMGTVAVFFNWVWTNMATLAALLYIKSIAIFGCRFFDKCESPLHYLFTLATLGLDLFRDYFLATVLNMVFSDIFESGDSLLGIFTLIVSPIALLLIFFAGIFPMYAVYPSVFGPPSKKEIPYYRDIYLLNIGTEVLAIFLLFLLKQWWS